MQLSEAFDDFDENCVASASLAQVHRARLKDGKLVAVKVECEEYCLLPTQLGTGATPHIGAEG